MQAPENKQKKIEDLILKVKATAGGFRLASFIELLQVMADTKKWKYLSTTSFEYAITDSEGLRMNDVYQYTMANFTDNITLAQIARVVYLTPQSFCRYFKKHTSKTYISFLNEIRINQACQQFTSMDFKSISAVAYQSGFNNVVTFNRVFKSITKKSPREFIKEYHKKTGPV
jgi:AraC-like DNA-binding protein